MIVARYLGLRFAGFVLLVAALTAAIVGSLAGLASDGFAGVAPWPLAAPVLGFAAVLTRLRAQRLGEDGAVAAGGQGPLPEVAVVFALAVLVQGLACLPRGTDPADRAAGTAACEIAESGDLLLRQRARRVWLLPDGEVRVLPGRGGFPAGFVPRAQRLERHRRELFFRLAPQRAAPTDHDPVWLRWAWALWSVCVPCLVLGLRRLRSVGWLLPLPFAAIFWLLTA